MEDLTVLAMVLVALAGAWIGLTILLWLGSMALAVNEEKPVEKIEKWYRKCNRLAKLSAFIIVVIIIMFLMAAIIDNLF